MLQGKISHIMSWVGVPADGYLDSLAWRSQEEASSPNSVDNAQYWLVGLVWDSWIVAM
jgi:hypothetical protein